MLLISCCNNSGKLIKYDEKNDTIDIVKNHEVKGFEILNKHIYCFCNFTDTIYKYDLYLKLVSKTFTGKNSHGIFVKDNIINVIATYYDSIFQYDQNLELINKIEFKPNETTIDIYHMNDWIFDNHSNCYYNTMFRDEVYGKLKIEDNFKDHMYTPIGVVKKTTVDQFNNNTLGKNIIEGLFQPHTPYFYEDKFYVCDSRNCSVNIYDRNNFNFINKYETVGFTRGLYIDDNYIYLGISSSVHHKIIENSKKIENKYWYDYIIEYNKIKANNKENASKCGIEIIDKQTLELVKFINLPATEVYSIKKFE